MAFGLLNRLRRVRKAEEPAKTQPPPRIPEWSMENFTKAFDGRSGSCARTCNCGREFFDDTEDNSWTWEEGEREKLREDARHGRVTAVDGAVGSICFEGRDYVHECDCWHPRAARVIAFIVEHGEAIAEFLLLEHKRKYEIAKASPVVKRMGVDVVEADL